MSPIKFDKKWPSCRILRSSGVLVNAKSALQIPLRWFPFGNGSLKIRSTQLGFVYNFFWNISFQISVHTQNGAENVFLSIVQAVTEVLNKSHFSLQMGNCPIPVAEHSGHSLNYFTCSNGNSFDLGQWQHNFSENFNFPIRTTQKRLLWHKGSGLVYQYF